MNEIRAREGFCRSASTIDDRRYQIVASSVRIDFAVGVPDEVVDVLGLPASSIGSIEDASGVFFSRASTLIESLDVPVIRLAVNALAHRPHETVEDCYITLANQIKNVRIDPNRTRELGYRINHRTGDETAPGGYLNRICSWSAQRVEKQIGNWPGERSVVMHDVCNAVIQVDINTDPENATILEKAELLPIFGRMMDLMAENVTLGEIE